DPDRKRRRLDATEKPPAPTRAIGPIRNAELGDAQPLDGGERPEILSGEQGDLLFQGHRGDKLVNRHDILVSQAARPDSTAALSCSGRSPISAILASSLASMSRKISA